MNATDKGTRADDDTRALKRVVLLGDSIRIGYQRYVQRALAAEAQVVVPEVNGRHAANVLRHLEPWAVAHDPDVIHVNAGLHDIKRDRNARHPATDPATYRHQIETIVRELRRRTSATVVWASTTPVIEARFRHKTGFDRFETDVLAYNRIARDICRATDTPIDDLYGFVTRLGKEDLLRDDGVHFSDDGYRLLGEEVARVIRSHFVG